MSCLFFCTMLIVHKNHLKTGTKQKATFTLKVKSTTTKFNKFSPANLEFAKKKSTIANFVFKENPPHQTTCERESNSKFYL